jgi:hypothetical protein
LVTITGSAPKDIEIQYLREWARLCFFNNNNSTIKLWLSKSNYPSADFLLDFESFYDGTILDQCDMILNKYNIKANHPETLKLYLKDFVKNNRYKDIDLDIEMIKQAFAEKKSFKFGNINFVKQAWIDNFLVKQYNINPLLTNEYWTSTDQILKAYNL